MCPQAEGNGSSDSSRLAECAFPFSTVAFQLLHYVIFGGTSPPGPALRPNKQAEGSLISNLFGGENGSCEILRAFCWLLWCYKHFLRLLPAKISSGQDQLFPEVHVFCQDLSNWWYSFMFPASKQLIEATCLILKLVHFTQFVSSPHSSTHLAPVYLFSSR